MDSSAGKPGASDPGLGPRLLKRAPGPVASFFADIAGATEVLDVAVEGMGASDNEVFSFLRFAVRMKSTGREASFHLHHYFRFGPDGNIEY